MVFGGGHGGEAEAPVFQPGTACSLGSNLEALAEPSPTARTRARDRLTTRVSGRAAPRRRRPSSDKEAFRASSSNEQIPCGNVNQVAL